MKHIYLLLLAVCILLQANGQPKPNKIERFAYDTIAQSFYSYPNLTQFLEYDQEGNITVSISDYDDGNSYRYTRTWQDGLAIQAISEHKDAINQDWTPYYKTQIELNERGYYKQSSNFNWNSGNLEWRFSGGTRWTYTYDSIGRVDSVYEEIASSFTQVWQLNVQSKFIYTNGDSIPDIIESVSWENSPQISKTRRICIAWSDTTTGFLIPGPSVYYTEIEVDGNWKSSSYDSTVVNDYLQDEYRFSFDSNAVNFQLERRTKRVFEHNGYLTKYFVVQRNGGNFDTLTLIQEDFQYGTQNEPLESIRLNRAPTINYVNYTKFIYHYNQTAISPWAQHALHLYPNPLRSGQRLVGGLEIDDTYRVIDMQGKLWLKGKNAGDGISCNLPAGLYLLQITRGEKHFCTRIQILP